MAAKRARSAVSMLFLPSDEEEELPRVPSMPVLLGDDPAAVALLDGAAREGLLDDLVESDRCRLHSRYGIAPPPYSECSAAEATRFARFLGDEFVGEFSRSGQLRRLRAIAWRRALGNPFRVRRPLFALLLRAARPSPMICRDVARTFAHLRRSAAFEALLREAELLLQAFAVHRPDLGYVQGMSYPAVALLLVMPPYAAFKSFCALVLGEGPLYDGYRFNARIIAQTRAAIDALAMRAAPRFRALPRSAEVCESLWVDCLYAAFLRTFDLRSAFAIWDFFVIAPQQTLCAVLGALFALFEESAGRLGVAGEALQRDCRALAFAAGPRLLAALAAEEWRV